jgi:DNA-binding SARP family transcriptional activator
MKAVTDGFGIATATGVHLMDFVLMGHGALCSMMTGDAATAKDLMRKMGASPGMTRPFEQSFYHHVSAWAALREGDLPNARLHSEQALKSPDAMLHWASLHLIYLQSAFIFIESGLKESAFADLARSRRIIGGNVDYAEFCCLLAEAFFLLRLGEEEAALAPLRDGMRTGREKGLGGVYQPYPGFLARVAAKALEAGIEVPYVRELIRKNRLIPDPSAVDLESWPWPVKVYTLGRFDLVVEEKVLVSARKTRQKPLLLLKALIALGGREVPEEQLTEVLWPEADGDLAHQSLAKTLERLREMLGDDRAVLLRDGRLTLNNRHCWVDVWEFERTLGRSDAERKAGGPNLDDGVVARLADKAIALYRGMFLSGETFCSCIVTRRERLRSKFLRMIVQTGRHWERSGEWEKAVFCYQMGLEVDQLSEELYGGLISCNLRAGRRNEAHAVYKRCCSTLSSVLGVSPSPDLQKMLTSGPSAPVRVD